MEEGTTPASPELGKQEVSSGYRAAIRDRLYRLVSPGTAMLYDDACKHLDADPPFSASTHIVGHLIREVESSVRDVLRPFADVEEELCEECGKPVSKENCACGRPKGLISHKKAIETALTTLGLQADDPLIAAWKDVSGRGHKYAHREGLEDPRPLDAEFLEYWSQMEAVLSGVLFKFEGEYTVVFDKLDDLAAKDPPTAADAKLLRSNFANNQTTRDYFFQQLATPAWLPLLRSEGFFKKPPEPIRFDDGGVRFPTWPPTIYLEQMAKISPAEVSAILGEVEETENEVVMGALVEVASALPDEHRTPIMSKLMEWI